MPSRETADVLNLVSPLHVYHTTLPQAVEAPVRSLHSLGIITMQR